VLNLRLIRSILHSVTDAARDCFTRHEGTISVEQFSLQQLFALVLMVSTYFAVHHYAGPAISAGFALAVAGLALLVDHEWPPSRTTLAIVLVYLAVLMSLLLAAAWRS
jgi:hypothetical protein